MTSPGNSSGLSHNSGSREFCGGFAVQAAFSFSFSRGFDSKVRRALIRDPDLEIWKKQPSTVLLGDD